MVHDADVTVFNVRRVQNIRGDAWLTRRSDVQRYRTVAQPAEVRWMLGRRRSRDLRNVVRASNNGCVFAKRHINEARSRIPGDQDEAARWTIGHYERIARGLCPGASRRRQQTHKSGYDLLDKRARLAFPSAAKVPSRRSAISATTAPMSTPRWRRTA